jgi:hypothetical protein
MDRSRSFFLLFWQPLLKHLSCFLELYIPHRNQFHSSYLPKFAVSNRKFTIPHTSPTAKPLPIRHTSNTSLYVSSLVPNCTELGLNKIHNIYNTIQFLLPIYQFFHILLITQLCSTYNNNNETCIISLTSQRVNSVLYLPLLFCMKWISNLTSPFDLRLYVV